MTKHSQVTTFMIAYKIHCLPENYADFIFLYTVVWEKFTVEYFNVKLFVVKHSMYVQALLMIVKDSKVGKIFLSCREA